MPNTGGAICVTKRTVPRDGRAKTTAWRIGQDEDLTKAETWT